MADTRASGGRHNVSKTWRGRRRAANEVRSKILKVIEVNNLSLPYSAPDIVRDRDINPGLLSGMSKNAAFKRDTLQIQNTNHHMLDRIKALKVAVIPEELLYPPVSQTGGKSASSSQPSQFNGPMKNSMPQYEEQLPSTITPFTSQSIQFNGPITPEFIVSLLSLPHDQQGQLINTLSGNSNPNKRPRMDTNVQRSPYSGDLSDKFAVKVPAPDTGYRCEECNKICKSKGGLKIHSLQHKRAHRTIPVDPAHTNDQEEAHRDMRVNIAVPETLECIICMEGRKEVMMEPCGHVCCCRNCAMAMRNNNRLRCPVCRASSDFRTVFIS